jgi:predicted nuclease of predicted toxin-antitoxin system
MRVVTSVVRALRGAGYDVLAIAEISPRADDTDVIDIALRAGRILLTEDKDFGQLVYASAHQSAGVILLRFSAPARATLVQSVLGLVDRFGARLVGAFVVAQPGRIRIGRLRGA